MASSRYELGCLTCMARSKNSSLYGNSRLSKRKPNICGQVRQLDLWGHGQRSSVMGIKKLVSKSDGETVRWRLSQETVIRAELFYHKRSTIQKIRSAFAIAANGL